MTTKPVMRFLRDLPIKRKLTFLTMLTSGMALLLACAAFVTYELIVFKKTMVTDHLSTAKMVGDNSSAAVSFNDPASAEQTLKALSAHPHIVAGAVYDKDGKLFARYQRASLKGIFEMPPVRPDGHDFGENHLELFYTISLSGETAGMVYLRSDLGEMRTRLWRYALIAVVVILTSFLAAFLLSRKLQVVISEPISQLARVASVVATDRNYSVRAVKQGEDELGHLIDGFNEMLAQIQARDADLQQAQDLLEKRVEERTSELQSEVTERQRSQNRLAESEHRLRMILEAQPECVKLVAADGTLLDMNPAGLKMVEADHLEQILSKPVCNLLVPEHRAVFQALNEAVFQGESRVAEFELTGLKGTRRWMETHACPLRDTAGRIIAQLAVTRDVTKRKLAETELARAHSKLLDASRQAGMAEVATGVLHNVGNVLNSVNVSATLLTDSLKKSKAANLGKAVTLMREHTTDLGGFLTRDPKGKQLPAYLGQLAEHLVAEQGVFLNEVESLRKNIEHIKEIVAMQQSYAKMSGVAEIIKVTDLVEDSLRMNAAALARHNILVVREFEEVPAVSVEKHKILQILVNLIRNAKYACDESEQADKQVTIRVAQSEDRVRIAVSDNGIGIPPENLTRIFAHGFTTKATGHGFGLHSGALAAKEMGGSLNVHSEGPGKGATFTLELPRESLQRAA